MDKKRQFIEKAIINILYPGLLLVYALILVNQGITTTDTGYNYGNFINFDSLDGMWKFSTYLATAIGAFFTKLPFGDTMLGLNIYTGLIKALVALMTYYFCVYAFEMKPWLAFFSQLAALGYCWCPTSLLYNYCTYLFFTLGGILLCLAVKKEKNRYYLLAGLFLGINVLVRFPNLAEAALIGALWCYCIIRKIKFSETLRRTALCIAGYLAGIGVVLGYIFLRYSPAAYVEGIRQILAMSKDASGYSLREMLLGDLRLYLSNLKWVWIAMAFCLLATLLYSAFRQRFMPCKRVLCVGLGIVLLCVYRRLYMFSGFYYYNYDAIYIVGVFFLLLAGLTGLYVMFFGGDDYELRMHAMVMGIIILITPLGSNNYLMTTMNNMFFVTPFLIRCCYKLAKSKRNISWKRLEISTEPLLILLTILTVFCSMQGILFGSQFVFRDGIYGEKRTAIVYDNKVLAGIYTTPENAEKLAELNNYLTEEDLKGCEALLYYNVPALAFYMDLKPALSSTWPDLASFSVPKFKAELEAIQMREDISENKPIVILGCAPEGEDDKMVALRSYLEELEYEMAFSNETFYIFR